MSKRFSFAKFPVGIAAVLFVLSMQVAAQTQTARLVGTVSDTSGGTVASAKITAVQQETKTSTTTTTNSSGEYVFPVLQPGTYSLSVEAPGFRKSLVDALELDAAANVSQAITLQVGQVTETIEVTANQVAVQTADAQINQSITLSDIETLPQLARTPITLAVFQPGVQINPQANGSSSGADYSFAHVNGLRQGSNNNTLDGIDVNDSVAPRIGLSLTANNTDSVEEARIVTDGGKAEYGRSAGGQVQLITRSGTNNLHGNLFDYLRNRDFNANDFFDNSAGVPIPVLIQNNFGGSIGGHIKRNKLFYFGNYQGIRTHAQGAQDITVPTATAKQGIFEYTSGGAVQQYSILNADPQHAGIGAEIAPLLALFPAPNNNLVGDGLNSAGYQWNFPNSSFSDQLTIKIDYQVSTKIHIFGRVSWQRNSAIDSLNGAQAVIPGQANGTQGGKRWGIAGGMDYILSSTLVNEFRYGHQSASVDFNRPERQAAPMISFNTFTTPIETLFGQGRNSPVDEYTDNLTKVHGHHTLKFGGQVRFTDQYGFNDAGIYPNISLGTGNGNTPAASVDPTGLTSTQLTTFQGLYNDILGRISSVTETFYSNLVTFQAPGTPRVRNFEYHEYGFFAQDDWRVKPNLTLNLGLRWEFYPVPYEQNGQQGILTPLSALNVGAQADNLTVAPSSNWYHNDYHSFAPRFGFAWDPWKDGKSAVRGGYGIFYDRIVGAASGSVDGATPGFSQNSSLFPNSGGTDVRVGSAPPLPVQPAAPVLTLPATRSTSADIVNPNLTNGYVQQFNLNFQRQIAKNTILDVGYVGNRGDKLFYEVNLNQSHIFNNGFLPAFQQLAANVTTPTAVPTTNPIVAIYGTAAAAISSIGASNLNNGAVGSAASTIDQSFYTKYAGAGLSEYYLRSFPQFTSLLYGNNDGHSRYNSLQIRLQHQFAGLRVTGNYTWSKSLDNDQPAGTGGEGNGFAAPLDSFNESLAKGRSNFDIPSAFTMTGIYTLPVGRGKSFGRSMPKWADTLIGGWDIGGLLIVESGSPFSVSSGFATGAGTGATYANFTGSRDIGGITTSPLGPGPYYFTPAQLANFSEPVAGTYGTSGRNSFRGPGFFNLDTSLVKKFRVAEHKALTFRAEAYNVINHVDFANPGVTESGSAISFGRISAVVNNPRIMQLALRLDF